MNNYYEDLLLLWLDIFPNYTIIWQNKNIKNKDITKNKKIKFFEDFDFNLKKWSDIDKYMSENPCLIVLDNLNLLEISFLINKKEIIIINCNTWIFGAKNKIYIENKDLSYMISFGFDVFEISDFSLVQKISANIKKWYIKVWWDYMNDLSIDEYNNSDGILRDQKDSNSIWLVWSSLRNNMLVFREENNIDSQIWMLYDYNFELSKKNKEIIQNAREIIFWIDDLDIDFLKTYFLKKISSLSPITKNIYFKNPEYSKIDFLWLEMWESIWFL